MWNSLTDAVKCAMCAYRCRCFWFIHLVPTRACPHWPQVGFWQFSFLHVCVCSVVDWIIIHTDWVLPEIPCEGRCKVAGVKDRNNPKMFSSWQIISFPLHAVQALQAGLHMEPSSSWNPPSLSGPVSPNWTTSPKRCAASPPDAQTGSKGTCPCTGAIGRLSGPLRCLTFFPSFLGCF